MIYSLYTLFLIISLGLLLASMWTMRKASALVSLGYFLMGMLLLGSIRFYFALVDSQVLQIDEMTVMVGWHLLFYLAAGTFLLASHGLSALADIRHGKQPWKFLLAWIAFSLPVALYIFFQSKAWDETIMKYFEGTLFERLGTLHFIALAFTATVIYYLRQVRQRFLNSIGQVSVPFIVSLVILAVIHVWELLGETWHLLPVSESQGEQVEKVLWVFVYGATVWAFWRLKASLVAKAE